MKLPWTSGRNDFNPLGQITLTAPKPTILYCPTCERKVAFGPLHGGEVSFPCTGDNSAEIKEHFTFAYECLHCRGPYRERIVFLVVRSGSKILLCGRDPFEEVPIEKYIPKKQAKFLSQAVVAYQAGHPLPGMFMLRVFIEQFWRSVEAIEQARQSKLKLGMWLRGDEMATIYADTLPTGLRDAFPALGTIYARLSEALHDAKDGKAAGAIFEEALEQINEHFDARRLFKVEQGATGAATQKVKQQSTSEP